MLIPRWVDNIESWWDQLLGPEIAAVAERVLSRSADPEALKAGYTEVVVRLERRLDEATKLAEDFRSFARADDWRSFAAHLADVVDTVRGRWVDPAATQPLGGVAGPAVILTAKRAVTAVGIIWAVSSVSHIEALILYGKEQAKRMTAGEPAPSHRRRVRR